MSIVTAKPVSLDNSWIQPISEKFTEYWNVHKEEYDEFAQIFYMCKHKKTTQFQSLFSHGGDTKL